jgi:hypothetical protein
MKNIKIPRKKFWNERKKHQKENVRKYKEKKGENNGANKRRQKRFTWNILEVFLSHPACEMQAAHSSNRKLPD